MWNRSLVVFVAVSLLLAGGLLYVPSGFANPPWDPFDDTRFAPIEQTGPPIGLEKVAIGLTAPLKGVVAPGLPNHLFVIDQDGQIWTIDLTAPRPVTCPGPHCTLFHDVGPTGLNQIVTLGCVPEATRSFGGSFDERGLLGLAFHPNFATNGKFYTYTSEPNAGAPTFPTTLPGGPGTGDHQNVIAEWQANDPGNPGAGVDASSRKELIRVDWPQFNHDGGDLAFRASDGTLFISMGDGGGADDRDGQDFVVCGSDPSIAAPMVGHGLDGNGQKLTNPLGKILRIDVDGNNSANGQYGIPADNPFVGAGGGVIEEIFAFGFRNPFRMSFDKEDPGHFYVGNVGQNDIEEVELVRSGANHGWPIKEGTLFFAHNFNDLGFATPVDPGTAVAPPALAPDLVDPVSQYDTHHEGHAVIAGFLYRGNEVPDLRGQFVFGDFSLIFRFPIGPQDHGRLFIENRVADPGGGLERIEELRIVPGIALSLALLGWGEDAGGELYPMGNISGLPFGNEGVVLKIVPAPVPTPAD
ncbi:MAG: PQQ-dependent sugar dehydrogenase [Candidatus Methylomirabilales bacterium]